jgi:hypothetical protein
VVLRRNSTRESAGSFESSKCNLTARVGGAGLPGGGVEGWRAVVSRVSAVATLHVSSCTAFSTPGENKHEFSRPPASLVLPHFSPILIFPRYFPDVTEFQSHALLLESPVLTLGSKMWISRVIGYLTGRQLLSLSKMLCPLLRPLQSALSTFCCKAVMAHHNRRLRRKMSKSYTCVHVCFTTRAYLEFPHAYVFCEFYKPSPSTVVPRDMRNL